MTTLDILLDTVKRLEHNADCLMRGIHADFTLIKKEDLRILLDDHKRLSQELFAAKQKNYEADFKQDLEKSCLEHKWVNGKTAGTCVCTKCGETGRAFCGGDAIPGMEYKPPRLAQDWDVKPVPTPIHPCEGMAVAQVKLLAEDSLKISGGAYQNRIAAEVNAKQDNCKHEYLRSLFTVGGVIKYSDKCTHCGHERT